MNDLTTFMTSINDLKIIPKTEFNKVFIFNFYP